MHDNDRMVVVMVEHVEMKQLEGHLRDCGRGHLDLQHAGTSLNLDPNDSSGLSARVMTRNGQLVTIRAGSKGQDLELSSSYYREKAMIDRAGGEEAAIGL